MQNSGVSPVIGIILLTAVTVGIVSIASVVVFEVGKENSASESIQDLSITSSENDTHYTVKIIHGSVNSIQLSFADSNYKKQLSNPQPGDTISVEKSYGNEIVVTASNGNSQTLVQSETIIINNIPTSVSEDWNMTYDKNNTDDRAGGLVAVSSGIVVTGASVGTDGDKDYYTVKYDTEGNVVWENRYDNGRTGIASDVAIDSDGNVIVTGRLKNSNDFDYYTIKYDSTGSEVWSNRYDNVKNDFGAAVATDKNNNVIVTGNSKASGDNDRDFVTIKYDSNGTKIWKKRYDSGNANSARGIAVGENNDIFITGRKTNNSQRDYLSIKYTKGGQLEWTADYNNIDKRDYGYGVVVSNNNNPIITGFSKASDNDRDAFTIKYNGTTGSQIWTQRYDTGSGNAAYAISIDRDGGFYISGYNVNLTADYHTVKYNASGNIQYTKSYDSGGKDVSTGISVTTNGDLYVTGYGEPSGTDFDYYTIKYKR